MNRQFKKLVLIWTVLLLAGVSPALAQFSGQLAPATTLPQGEIDIGTFFGVYEDAWGFWVTGRYGVAPYMDVCLKAGPVTLDRGRADSETGFGMAGDLKYNFMDVSGGDPFEMSAGSTIEFASIGETNFFSIGVDLTGSRLFRMSSGRSITPYARFNLRMERRSVDVGPQKGDKSDTDLELGLNPGGILELSPTISLLSELQLDEYFGMFLGVVFKMN